MTFDVFDEGTPALEGTAIRRQVTVHLDGDRTGPSMDALLDERGRELMGEVNRWYDLVRTGKFLERVLAHNRKAAAAGFVREHHALRPIPQSQIDAVENECPQNPGY